MTDLTNNFLGNFYDEIRSRFEDYLKNDDADGMPYWDMEKTEHVHPF